ncbi:sugar transferase [Candidatus Omnitrophota bacterium]
MGFRNQVKFNLNDRSAASLYVILLLAFVVFFIRGSLAFAITYFDQPKISSSLEVDTPQLAETTDAKPVQKSRAPEASTMFLFLGGIGGMVVRFVRKSFDKFKRLFDIFFSVLGLILASPILLVAAILIKFNSKGPVVYKQNRIGRDGDVFEIYKLRTMRIDAEEGTGAIWARVNDPRVTKVGKFLRATHIDEIPQFINVLRGEMSIVGPRPERPEMVRDLKKVILDYEKRLCVKPGITGLAQVWHKYDETIEDVKKKIKYDLMYIRKMCLMVDLRILAQTLVAVIIGKGAR